MLADALARGGPFRPGRAVEIASGTGLLTLLIAQVWPEVIAVDLSGGMLARSAARVMAAGAVLVWSNALGDGAPFYVPAEVLAGAMIAATGGPWDAVHSQAHWGS